MLPGISGTLIAPSFLERELVTELSAARDWNRSLRQMHQWWRRTERTLGPASSVRALADLAALPFLEARNYHVRHLEPHGGGFTGTLARPPADTLVAVRIAPWGSDPDREWRDTVRAGRTGNARWAFVFSGPTLRLVDAARTWSRRALDFDFARVLSDERSATALVALVEAAGNTDNGALTLDTLVARSEQHGVAVCASLGEGVLEALTALVAELDPASRRRNVSDKAAFEQAVTIVYRLLFLLFAEARALVPVWHQTYREAYSIDALCRRTLGHPSRPGVWKALQAIARLAHRGCQAGDLVVTPFNGRLFAPRHTPLAEEARLSDAVVGKAIVALATAAGTSARERIAYGDLGVEQLGAVYERVLEYEPARDNSGLRLARTSHDRKSTGSFYTPRSITDFLVRRALHPLVRGKTSEQILNLRVLDPAMGSGAFLVAACRFLGDAVERAMADEGLLVDATTEDRAGIRRMVAQRCLFGVDLNPMAVQLARLSLWLASLSGDRPLTFLDHHLATGDSLIGATLAGLARNPVARAPRDGRHTVMPLFGDEHESVMSATILPERFRLAVEPGDTPSAVHAKETALARLTAGDAPLGRWKQAADLWCAIWFWGEPRPAGGVYADVLAALTGGQAALHPQQRAGVLTRARTIAGVYHFFHWELEFPEVFFTPEGVRDANGGFDAVIGNPPWDVLRADTGSRAARDLARADHRARLRFFRDARAYRCQGAGHANRYQLFLERALQLTRPGGRLALILPSGLATDQGSAALRREVLDTTHVDRLIGFDNRAAIFPIHRDVRFLLLTATKGGRTDTVGCTFGHSDAQFLDRLPDSSIDEPPATRGINVPRTTLERWDPEHVALPWLQRTEDLEILSDVTSRVPPLASTEGWHVRFGRELNASDDRAYFVPRSSATAQSLLPVLDGKHLEPFRIRTENSTRAIAAARAASLVDADCTFRRSRLAYRDVASATNRLTLLAARLAAGTISTHTLFCSKDTLGEDAQYCLLALLNSLVANYLVRLRVTTHVTTAIMARLPVPRPSSRSHEFHELATLARELERTGLAGHDSTYARLNAIATRLYGLTGAQYRHVLGTFPLLPRDLIHAAASAYGGDTDQACETATAAAPPGRWRRGEVRRTKSR